MAYFWFNFRSSQAGGTGFPGPGPDDVYVLSADGYPTTRSTSNGQSLTFGNRSTDPVAINFNSPASAHLGGCHRAFGSANNFFIYYRFDLPNAGYYTAKLALNTLTGGNTIGWALWDGDINDPVNGVAQTTVITNLKNYVAAQVYAVGQYVITSGNLYRVSAITGTGAAGGTKPTHTSGSVVDGGADSVTWTYIRSSLFSVLALASTTNNFTDISGADLTPAAWAAAGGAESAPFNVTSGYVTGLRVSDTGEFTRLAALGFQTYVTPLSDVTLTDEFGDAAPTPAFHAQQPQGYAFVKINSSVGDQNFAIDPTSDLYPYVEVQQLTSAMNNNPGYWVVAKSTPIPDSLAGTKTLKIVQTSTGVSNHTTAFNVTVVSSGGRTLDTNTVLDKICTQSWMNRKVVEDKKATKWAGWTGQTFASTTDVSTTAAFVAAWNALTPDGTSWYCIRLRDGNFTGSCLINSKNFGTGGMLLTSYPGETPRTNWAFEISAVHGLHIRGITSPGVKADIGQTNNWLFKDPGSGSAYFTKVKIDQSNFGIMFEPGKGESDIISNGTLNSIFLHTGVSAEIVDNVFDGASSCVVLYGTALHIVERNEFRRILEDCIDWCPLYRYNSTDVQTITGSSTIYRSNVDNLYPQEIDFSTAVNGKHGDWEQLRLMSSPTGAFKQWAANTPAFAVGDSVCIGLNIYKVASITTGTTGTTAPSGTGTGIVDGGVTWDYVQSINAVTTYEVFSAPAMLSQTLTTSSAIDDRQLFFSNFDLAGWTRNVSFYDNCEGTNGAYGCEINHAGNYWLERSVMVMGGRQNASVQTDEPSISNNYSGKVLVRGVLYGDPSANSGATYGGKLAEFNSARVSFRSTASTPAAYLRGPFATYDATNRWGYDAGATTSATTLKNSMRAILAPATGVDAGIYVPASSGAGAYRVRSLSLGLRLGL